jgi:rhamnulokinase
MFISSGTCSLLGVLIDEPLVTKEACDAHFTNEGTLDGGIRFLRNLVGMWVIQECQKEWAAQGEDLSWNEIVSLTEKEKSFRSLIDMQEPQFFNTGNMIRKIQDYCKRTGQPVPETKGQIARCIYESLALRYRMVWEKLQQLTGKHLTAVRIIGGGSNNRLLNQMTADAIGCPVYTGPGEASSIGNLLAQAMAFGEIANQDELRDVVRRSFEIGTVEPHTDASWQEAYEKYKEMIYRENPSSEGIS